MYKLIRSVAPAMVLLGAAIPAFAQTAPECLTNASASGNVLTGRNLSTYRDYPNLGPDEAFSAVLRMLGQQEGVTVTRSEPPSGLVQGGYTEGGIRLHTFEYRITSRAGGGTRITLSHRLLPATAVRTAGWAAKVCVQLDALAAGERAPGSTTARSAAPLGGSATPLEQARANGLAYGEVVAGSLTVPEQLVRLRLRDASAGDTVVLQQHDPRQVAGIGDPSTRWVSTTLRMTLQNGGGPVAADPLDRWYILRGPGPFEIRVDSEEQPPVPLMIRVLKHSGRPERIPARITPGDTIRGEELEHARDTDDYFFAGRAGQEIQVYYWTVAEDATLTEAPGMFAQLFLQQPNGQLRDAQNGTASWGSGNGVYGVYTLPATGTYVFRVGKGAAGTGSVHTGAYAFRLRMRE